MSKALYPYTLKPISLNLNDAEFRSAQLALFEKSANNFSLTSIKIKEWVILLLVTAAAIAGLVFVTGYSTILFWVMLVLVVLYLLARTLGLKWYVRREYDKQVASTQMPAEMANLQLGVQSHGLVMSMPNTNDIMQNQMRGMQMRASATQSAVIPWQNVTSWDETDEYVFIMFEIKDQKGSQIIPKRLEKSGLPINTIKKHLQQIKPAGLQPMTAN